MSPAGFEPLIPVSERAQTNVLDPAATGMLDIIKTIILTSVLPIGIQITCGFHILEQEEVDLPRNSFLTPAASVP
jgi:hypothetical protein